MINSAAIWEASSFPSQVTTATDAALMSCLAARGMSVSDVSSVADAMMRSIWERSALDTTGAMSIYAAMLCGRVVSESRPDKDNRAAQNAAAVQLIDLWLADESGYDERVWQTAKRAIESHRMSSRRRFSE